MIAQLEVQWLGRIAFPRALAQQEEIVRRKHALPETSDALLLLEHEPVYTIGRTLDRSSLRGSEQLPHPLFEINRGGQATYHGPGQLIGYFLLDLRRHGHDLHRYLRWIEGLLIKLLAQHELGATTRPGLTGVWVKERKIASIGIGIRHWITMHGFALNVGGDLSPFDWITPCGIASVEMTSLARETGSDPGVESLAKEMATLARESLGDLRPCSSTAVAVAV